MRWISPVVAGATIVGAGFLGFAPTSVGLSNGVGDLQCRPLLSSVSGASLVGDRADDQSDVTERWLESVGYIDEGENPSVELAARADATAQGLCGEARQSRMTWIGLVAVFGTGLTLLAARRRAALPEGDGARDSAGAQR
ncbi:hypothetical protein B0I12_003378 [Microbacterium hydrothermale]|uniref:Uncharacterized protein n=1 Tax=Microbacterium phycohabitans TaxID=3075993 RepID=A0ABU3SKU1_9MICO|nr:MULTISPECIES: hypothetical protein [Microbacterium]MCW2166208.1 hypothetical protein [Microbacterium hydrothermale]MDU0345000.1 hypothetical protein [Microbacterium sp. KSW2-29]